MCWKCLWNAPTLRLTFETIRRLTAEPRFVEGVRPLDMADLVGLDLKKFKKTVARLVNPDKFDFILLDSAPGLGREQSAQVGQRTREVEPLGRGFRHGLGEDPEQRAIETLQLAAQHGHAATRPLIPAAVAATDVLLQLLEIEHHRAERGPQLVRQRAVGAAEPLELA